MTDEARPPRRRPRGRRRGARPQQAPAEPQRPARPEAPRDRDRRARPAARPDRDRALAPRDSFARDRRTRRGGRGRGQRAVADLRPGPSCLILLAAREGEPDRSGSPALFAGFFDFETGEPRRAQSGIPRLRVGDERLWGFECWWRVDTERAGLTDNDREALETSKRLLRGLLRDSRRRTRLARWPPGTS